MLWILVIPSIVFLIVSINNLDKRNKVVLKELVRTPITRRNERLEKLCGTFGVEYLEVWEDDGGQREDSCW